MTYPFILNSFFSNAIPIWEIITNRRVVQVVQDIWCSVYVHAENVQFKNHTFSRSRSRKSVEDHWLNNRKQIRWVSKFLLLQKQLLCQSWVTSWQNQQIECTSSEGSDQPGHPPSLIRVFAVCMKKPWFLSYLLSTQRRLWSNWADVQADQSLCWAQSFCWFCHEVAQLLTMVSIKKF